MKPLLRLLLATAIFGTCLPHSIHAQQTNDPLRLEALIPVSKGAAFFVGGTSTVHKNGTISTATKAEGMAISSYKPTGEPMEGKRVSKAAPTYFQPIGAGFFLGSDKAARLRPHSYATVRYTLY